MVSNSSNLIAHRSSRTRRAFRTNRCPVSWRVFKHWIERGYRGFSDWSPTPRWLEREPPAHWRYEIQSAVWTSGQGHIPSRVSRGLDRRCKIFGWLLRPFHKNTENNQPENKARFVLQGHMYNDKYLIVKTSNTIRQHQILMQISIAAIFGLRIWSQDV